MSKRKIKLVLHDIAGKDQLEIVGGITNAYNGRGEDVIVRVYSYYPPGWPRDEYLGHEPDNWGDLCSKAKDVVYDCAMSHYDWYDKELYATNKAPDWAKYRVFHQGGTVRLAPNHHLLIIKGEHMSFGEIMVPPDTKIATGDIIQMAPNGFVKIKSWAGNNNRWLIEPVVFSDDDPYTISDITKIAIVPLIAKVLIDAEDYYDRE